MNRPLIKPLISALIFATALVSPSLAERPSHYVDDMWIDEGERIRVLEPDIGVPLDISGWTRRGRGDVYRVRVSAGDRLRLDLSSKSDYLLMAVFDFATPDAQAIFFSEPDNRQTVLTIKTDTELLIRPILILGQSRRGLGVNYHLLLERLALNQANQGQKTKAQNGQQ